MIVATAFLAVMQVLVKALPDIPVTQIILFRACISIAICTIILRTKSISFKGKNIPLLTLRGLIGTASLLTFFYTIQHIPLASAVTIGNLSPLFLGLMAVFFLKEKMAGLAWLSFLISFSGVFMLKGFDPRITSLELFLAVLSALLAATAHFTVRMLKDENPNVVLFYFSLVAIPLLAPFSILNWVKPDFTEWMFLIGTGIISHIAQYYLTKAFKEAEISNVAGVYYLGILIAILLGYFIYDESFTAESYLGMFLITSGVILAIFSKSPLQKKPAIP
jgi:drug/metabolite transporter (DMT)-like permease